MLGHIADLLNFQNVLLSFLNLYPLHSAAVPRGFKQRFLSSFRALQLPYFQRNEQLGLDVRPAESSAAQPRPRAQGPPAARAPPEPPRRAASPSVGAHGSAGQLPTLSIWMRQSSGLFMLTVHSFQCLFMSVATYAKIAQNDIDKMIAEDRTHNRN